MQVHRQRANHTLDTAAHERPKSVMHAFVNDLTPIAKVESVICGGSNLMLVNDDWLTLTLDPVDAFWLGDQAE